MLAPTQLLVGALVMCAVPALAHARPFKTRATQAEQVTDFVPFDYEIEARIDGDLNGDRHHDAALILIEDEKSDPSAVRERALVILFATASGFTLAASNQGLVSNTESSGHLASTGGATLSIKKGILSITATTGTTGQWHEWTDRFRYDPETHHFLRIGTEQSFGGHDDEESTGISTNLLTSIQIKTERPARRDFQGNGLPKRRAVVTKTTVAKAPLLTLESMDGTRE